MTGNCEFCGIFGMLNEMPCWVGHALCEKCRETFERFYFCEDAKCFLTAPVQEARGVEI
jgi:hypothetical protein